MQEVVYVVKFNRGYYSANQPSYDWSFTDNYELAEKYKTLKAAEHRGEWGLGLIRNPLKSYTIEKYLVKTTMELVE